MEVTDGVIEGQEPRTAIGSGRCCSHQRRSEECDPAGPLSAETHAANSGVPSRGDLCQRADASQAVFCSSQAVLYAGLLQLAADIFEPEELRRLVPPKRTYGSQAGAAEAELDPIAFTETVAYQFLARGGKQARPFMTLATYIALGLPKGLAAQSAAQDHLSGQGSLELPDQVKRVALSIETFHKASLVHDDIEDEDEFRYGQLTLHRRYGIASAINVGDYLIGLGYRLVSRDALLHGSEVAAELLDILADAHQRLCEGQGAELYWRDALDKQLRPADALQIYELKTSPAFEAALMCGARLRGPIGVYREAFRRFARHIGIAFQILNDLKDWESDEGNKKSLGADLLGGRPTVLWAIALEKLPPAEQELLLGLPSEGSLSAAERTERARTLYRQADVFSAARQLVLEQRAAAAAVVSELPAGALQQLLDYIIETVLNRPHGLQAD